MCIHTYIYVYIYIPATSTCAIFLPPSKEYKISAPENLKPPLAVCMSKKKCPWKIIPESYLSSYIPSCDSNVTSVGDCLCLLPAPNQRLKSVHDMPVWDEQVARMA